MKVALFITCFNDTLFPQVGIATTHLLERLGHGVVFPETQTCCGQMHYNTGYQQEALTLVRHFVKVFGASDVEAIVAPSASCAGMVRDLYPRAAAQAGDARLVAQVDALVTQRFVQYWKRVWEDIVPTARPAAPPPRSGRFAPRPPPPSPRTGQTESPAPGCHSQPSLAS
jgi:Cysteine-rich domain